MAPPSSRRRRKKKAMATPAPQEVRVDWSTLPHDILYSIFLMLGQHEIMQGAEFVCAAWRRVAVGEPTLWRRVDLADKFLWLPSSPAAESAMIRAAVDRSAGQCVSFWGPLDDDLTHHLVERYHLLLHCC
ncbi:hypothetical protein HU200_056133 [Digitaria exilis]|uniref:F-box domain-containing protein n=1 Tax=Digitaria exilis TaxID=1010633 RepID=A0A835E649_9POAL|nr:hypothetical protein HU200_056133 [Digitaria exilis]CAB3480290.1 unnamed protein product [Digitaria exilis]